MNSLAIEGGGGAVESSENGDPGSSGRLSGKGRVMERRGQKESAVEGESD